MEKKDDDNRIFYYKYYALHKFSSQAMGILNEEMGEISYHDLVIDTYFDSFQNKEVETIMRHKDIGEKKMRAQHLLEDSEQYEFTKEFWAAFEHMTGKKRAAINTNDTTAG